MTSKPIDLPDSDARRCKVFFNDQITSLQADHRTRLRNELLTIVKSLGETNIRPEQILDLTKLPSSNKFSISLSHCKQASVILLGPSNFRVGVDLEEISRVTSELTKRISHGSHELQKKPQSFDLFTAKESAWKALNSSMELKALPHIETLNWQAVDSQWYRFEVSVNNTTVTGKGFQRQFGAFSLSFFIQPSTFS